MYSRGEAKYVEREMARTLQNGLRPATAIGISCAPGNVRPGHTLIRSRKERFLARVISGIHESVHDEEDVESKAFAT